MIIFLLSFLNENAKQSKKNLYKHTDRLEIIKNILFYNSKKGKKTPPEQKKMKEKLNRDLLDLRKFDGPINPIEIIKGIVSNPVS